MNDCMVVRKANLGPDYTRSGLPVAMREVVDDRDLVREEVVALSALLLTSAADRDTGCARK